jgi:hypothetical protein
MMQKNRKRELLISISSPCHKLHEEKTKGIVKKNCKKGIVKGN